jgi:DNA repair protein RadA/Sms
MILAVLEKGRFQAWRQRRFPQHTGGISVDDPAIDLAVVAILSLKTSQLIKVLFCRRSGLVWEIRPVNRVDQRIQEAEKLGFDHFVSKYNKISLKNTV